MYLSNSLQIPTQCARLGFIETVYSWYNSYSTYSELSMTLSKSSASCLILPASSAAPSLAAGAVALRRFQRWLMGLFESVSALSVLCSSHTRWNVSSLLPARLLRKRTEVAAKGSVNGRRTLRSSTESRAEEVIVALACEDRMRGLGGGSGDSRARLKSDRVLRVCRDVNARNERRRGDSCSVGSKWFLDGWRQGFSDGR